MRLHRIGPLGFALATLVCLTNCTAVTVPSVIIAPAVVTLEQGSQQEFRLSKQADCSVDGGQLVQGRHGTIYTATDVGIFTLHCADGSATITVNSVGGPWRVNTNVRWRPANYSSPINLTVFELHQGTISGLVEIFHCAGLGPTSPGLYECPAGSSAFGVFGSSQLPSPGNYCVKVLAGITWQWTDIDVQVDRGTATMTGTQKDEISSCASFYLTHK